MESTSLPLESGLESVTSFGQQDMVGIMIWDLRASTWWHLLSLSWKISEGSQVSRKHYAIREPYTSQVNRPRQEALRCQTCGKSLLGPPSPALTSSGHNDLPTPPWAETPSCTSAQKVLIINCCYFKSRSLEWLLHQ